MKTSKNMVQNKFKEGVQRFLFDYCKTDSGSNLIIAWTKPYKVIAANIIKIATELNLKTNSFDLNKKFSDLEQMLQPNDTLILLHGNNSVYSLELLDAFGKDRLNLQYCTRVFDACNDIFSRCFQISQQELFNLNLSLINTFEEAETIRVRSASGTDLSIKLDSEYGWINNYGGYALNYQPAVMPPGEVATYSPDINGCFVRM